MTERSDPHGPETDVPHVRDVLSFILLFAMRLRGIRCDSSSPENSRWLYSFLIRNEVKVMRKFRRGSVTSRMCSLWAGRSGIPGYTK